MSRCRLCQNADVIGLRGSGISIFGICEGCGSIQQDGAFDRSGLAGMDIYGGTPGYARFCLTFGQNVFRHLPLVRYMPPGRALQIEANDGYLATTWIHRGWRVDATSLSKISALRAGGFGVRIIADIPSEVATSSLNPSYDMIISEMGHCRFPSPLSEVSSLLPGLRRGGAFLIHGPNPASSNLLMGDHPHLSTMNLSLPHPDVVIRFCELEGLVLIHRQDVGPDVTMLFIRVDHQRS